MLEEVVAVPHRFFCGRVPPTLFGWWPVEAEVVVAKVPTCLRSRMEETAGQRPSLFRVLAGLVRMVPTVAVGPVVMGQVDPVGPAEILVRRWALVEDEEEVCTPIKAW